MGAAHGRWPYNHRLNILTRIRHPTRISFHPYAPQPPSHSLQPPQARTFLPVGCARLPLMPQSGDGWQITKPEDHFVVRHNAHTFHDPCVYSQSYRIPWRLAAQSRPMIRSLHSAIRIQRSADLRPWLRHFIVLLGTPSRRVISSPR